MVVMFEVTNNEVQYESLVTGLCLARGMSKNSLILKCVSELVVSHVKGEYTAMDEKMKKYIPIVEELIKNIKNFLYI